MQPNKLFSLCLTLMVAAFWVNSAVAAEKKMVKDPSTGQMGTSPEYGGLVEVAGTVRRCDGPSLRSNPRQSLD